MDTALEQIRDAQQASWNKFSSGWKKWDEVNMAFLGPMGSEIIKLLHPEPNDVVLDIASGTGEPGLTIAASVQKVVISDLSEDMLAIAHTKAHGRPNVEFVPADACALPFPAATFDAVSCRMGFMFFPSMEQAAREMFRVLKPGGRIAISVWNIAERNFWVTAIMGVINKHLSPPPPQPGAPGMFRCAPQGMMADLFEKVGFTGVDQYDVDSQLDTGTAENYWTLMTEVGAPIVAALSKADDATREAIHRETVALVKSKCPESVAIDASAWIVYGVKPTQS